MESQVKLLNIGDVIYDTPNGKYWKRYVIDKVTSKQASGNGLTVKRQVEVIKSYWDNSEREEVKIIGSYGNAIVESEVIKNEYFMQQQLLKAKRLWRDFKIDNISNEQAAKIISFMDELETKF